MLFLYKDLMLRSSFMNVLSFLYLVLRAENTEPARDDVAFVVS